MGDVGQRVVGGTRPSLGRRVMDVTGVAGVDNGLQRLGGRAQRRSDDSGWTQVASRGRWSFERVDGRRAARASGNLGQRAAV